MTEDERRRRVSRRAVLAGLGTAAAIGAGFVAIPLLRNRAVAGVAGPFPTGAVALSGNPRAPMLVGPGWLPDGFVEVGREATLGDPRLVRRRTWLRDPRQPQTGAVVTYLFPPRRQKPLNSATPSREPNRYDGPGDVQIGGRPGWVDSGPPDVQAAVEWLIGDDMLATVGVSGLTGAADVALQIAHSVRRDEAAMCETSLRFGWLPSGIPGDQLLLRLNADGAGGVLQTLSLERYELPTGPSVIVRLGKREVVSDSPLGGDFMTVRGRPGYAGFGASYGLGSGSVLVQLGPDLWLAILASGFQSPPQGRDDLVRIADELEIGPKPDTTWIRTR